MFVISEVHPFKDGNGKTARQAARATSCRRCIAKIICFRSRACRTMPTRGPTCEPCPASRPGRRPLTTTGPDTSSMRHSSAATRSKKTCETTGWCSLRPTQG
ncbi:hypothetical protein [Pusillimonas sp. ANT_WB101]|uniref:hypothetical protein n=1 Tax=Pusillimonas sp. ANT_WB101 TaxID=2597356 RepID=UPI001CAA81F9